MSKECVNMWKCVRASVSERGESCVEEPLLRGGAMPRNVNVLCAYVLRK